ncbi:EamA family transporter [Maridesulfovibrio sp.]|uniref:DMT family transporter n=1 Tax=Maridesulfovibrio sp. TaxID=2795000 RepID=UPI002A18E8D3|nr:EamA family transporter [Maridesulfovibrio sp.]
MQGLPFLLVLLSAVAHGYWNFLFKQAENKDAFLCLSKILEPLIYLVPFMFALNVWGVELSSLWYVAIGMLLAVANYMCLSGSYKLLDLTIAYPVSRSSTVFLPFLAFIFLGEHIDVVGWCSVILVSLGVVFIPLNEFKFPDLSDRAWVSQKGMGLGMIFAVLAAFTVALYTLWGKLAIQHMHPFIYMYCYTLAANVYFLPLLRRLDRSVIRREWEVNKWRIIGVSVLNTLSFVLILFALTLGKVTYVGALRQFSLVVGVGLGWLVLREVVTVPRIVGVGLVIAGGCLTYLAK